MCPVAHRQLLTVPAVPAGGGKAVPPTQRVGPWVERVANVANVGRGTAGPWGKKAMKSKPKTQDGLQRELSGWKQKLES